MATTKKYIIFGFFFFLCPTLVIASEGCSSFGYTVVFINGIFNTRDEAQESKRALEAALKYQFNREPLTTFLGYNATHVEGLGDLAQVAAQGFGGTISTFDRDTILMQIAPELTTRKVLLVGHSQGTFYSNDMYTYFLSHGEPKESVGVYNVATPANYVAGGGKYVTSKADTIIGLFADYAKRTGALAPLAPNADLDPGAAVGNGHNFVNNYLQYAGDRIVAQIQGELSNLKATWNEPSGECFTPPQNNLSYKAKQTLFAVVDPVATGVKVATITGVNGATLAVNGIKTGLAAVGSYFAGANPLPAPRTENLPGSYNVVSAIYGSSVSEKDLNSLAQSQGGAVALALPSSVKTSTKNGEVKGVTTESFQPLIPPTVLFPSGTPGFGGGGGGGGALVVHTSEPETPVTPDEETPPVPTEEETPPVEETTPPVEETPVEDTTPPAPTYTTLLAQPDTSLLGKPNNPLVGYVPGQRLGKDFSGSPRSVVYKIHGTDFGDMLLEGWVFVELRDCMVDNGSYAPVGHCSRAASGISETQNITANGGDDYTISVELSPYTFDPTHYYWFKFYLGGDMALYGSASENAYQDATLEGAWIMGMDFINPIADTNGVKDWAFRICETTTCEL